MRRAAVLIPVVALTLAASVEARAAVVTREKLKIVGETAFAVWNYTQGSIATHVEVIVSNNNIMMNGEKSSDAFVSVAINQFDTDTNQVLLDAEGQATSFDFNLHHDLNSATLNVPSLEMINFGGDQPGFTVSVSLSWQGTGELVEQTIKEKTKVPGMRTLHRFKGDMRDGTAGGSIVGNATQYTPVTSESAFLQLNKDGSMTIMIEH
jgi:hypothetical protein